MSAFIELHNEYGVALLVNVDHIIFVLRCEKGCFINIMESGQAKAVMESYDEVTRLLAQVGVLF